MILRALRWLYLARDSARQGITARRLAMGFALGMAIGLIPKDSLFVILLGLIAVCTTANLAMTAVSAFLFTWVGHFLDGLSHKLGAMVLTSANLESYWAYLYELPLMPWTRFNNTVVMGSLILACLLFFPAYQLSCYFFQYFGPRIRARVHRNRIYRWVMGGHVTAKMEGAK